MKHKQPIINEQIQYKGFMINREGCKYQIQGHILTFHNIDLAKWWIDEWHESQNKISETLTKIIIAENENSNRSDISGYAPEGR